VIWLVTSRKVSRLMNRDRPSPYRMFLCLQAEVGRKDAAWPGPVAAQELLSPRVGGGTCQARQVFRLRLPPAQSDPCHLVRLEATKLFAHGFEVPDGRS
jgi:hypothetical protein